DVLWSHTHQRDLARHEVPAVVQLAIDDDARADARPDGDERTRIVPTGGAAPPLAENRKVHVIFDNDRRAQISPQDLRHWHLRPPFEIRRERDDDAAIAIDDTRRAGSGGEQPANRYAGVGEERAHLARESRR